MQMASQNGMKVKADVELPVYEFVAYFAMQTLSKEKCLDILSSDKEQYRERQEIISDMEEREALCYLHESVVRYSHLFIRIFMKLDIRQRSMIL